MAEGQRKIRTGTHEAISDQENDHVGHWEDHRIHIMKVGQLWSEKDARNVKWTEKVDNGNMKN